MASSKSFTFESRLARGSARETVTRCLSVFGVTGNGATGRRSGPCEPTGIELVF